MIATIILFASLGLDTLAVSLGVGISGLPRSQWLRVGLTFAAFEGGMPIVGLLLGRQLGPELGVAATYLAATLLLVVGLLTVREALGGEASSADAATVVLSGRALIVTGLSIGLDELAVGFSIGVLGTAVGPALAYVALQAFVLTLIGLFLGERVSRRLGERAELAAGAVLTVLALALIVNEAIGGSLL